MDKKVYLAGKITKNGWRHDIFQSLRSYPKHGNVDAYGFPYGEPLNRDGFAYQGPYFLADDHGTYHGEHTHGRGVGKNLDSDYLFDPDTLPENGAKVLAQCKKGITRASHVFVWLDQQDAYGTFAEIGYAHALNKKVFIAVDEKLEGTSFVKDIWFLLQMADTVIFTENHTKAWQTFVETYK